jgi:hypothetical protein
MDFLVNEFGIDFPLLPEAYDKTLKLIQLL